MNDPNRQHGGGYMSGFMMGAMIGAAAVFFLGTKKGKHVAKVIRKKGNKSFKDLEELLQEIEDKGEVFAKKAKVVTQKLEKQAQSTSKDINKIAKKKLSHIKKLQEKGRAAAARYFHKQGKTLN